MTATNHVPTPHPDISAWSPFHHIVYRRMWIASVVANTGAWVYSAAAAWMMTSFDAGPLMVSLVQVATSLPMFLFALPAGALADIINQRRFILTLEILVAGIAGLFAVLVSAGWVAPWTLLLFTFAIGIVEALEAPSWQSVVPQLVPKQDLGPAIAASSVGINISRAIGPALAGAIIAGAGITAPFWLVAFSNFGVIGVFWWWKPSRAHERSLPPERVVGAIRIGFRYARNNRLLRATLARSVGFFLFASAYWALLPLLARNQIGGGPELYGILLGAIGAGAVGGAFILPQLKAKIGANRLVALGEVGTAVGLILFGLAREPIMATFASLAAGICWIAVVASLNVSAQKALPDWVRGRGLAIYVTVFFGTMTLGSAAWGALSEVVGLSVTHYIAALGAIAAVPLTSRWKLHTDANIDLTPSMHWPEPVVTEPVENDAGPVMVTVEYRIEIKNRDAFLQSVEDLARERKRDGSYAWGIFQDTADDTRFVETFYLESWAEHLRQHHRVTKADRLLERNVRKYLSELPKTTHYIAADRKEGE
ncbi:MFS transporter [Afipia felis]|nr:MFS transporter [Afipia felis]